MTRVNNTSVVKLTNDFLEKHHNMPYICGVDIFPLDYVTRDKQEEKIQKEAPETFPMAETRLPIYNSLPPDHSGTPRDVRDLIRDSEQPSVHQNI